jgi:hypothetical protein
MTLGSQLDDQDHQGLDPRSLERILSFVGLRLEGPSFN